jgi:hypothetical protein
LQSRNQICTPRLEEPLLQVQAYDSSGKAVSGVEAVVTWEGGEEHFFTGLQPEKGLGYADFTLTPGVVYTLRLGEGGQAAGEITAAECTVGGERFWGAWLLTFKQQ